MRLSKDQALITKTTEHSLLKTGAQEWPHMFQSYSIFEKILRDENMKEKPLWQEICSFNKPTLQNNNKHQPRGVIDSCAEDFQKIHMKTQTRVKFLIKLHSVVDIFVRNYCLFSEQLYCGIPVKDQKRIWDSVKHVTFSENS